MSQKLTQVVCALKNIFVLRKRRYGKNFVYICIFCNFVVGFCHNNHPKIIHEIVKMNEV